MSDTPKSIEECGEPAASFIPRWGMSFACVLPKGHDGEHKRGGTCFAHGKYVGEQCPKWPECIASLTPQTAPDLDLLEGLATRREGDEAIAQRDEARLMLDVRTIEIKNAEQENDDLIDENNSLKARLAALDVPRPESGEIERLADGFKEWWKSLGNRLDDDDAEQIIAEVAWKACAARLRPLPSDNLAVDFKPGEVQRLKKTAMAAKLMRDALANGGEWNGRVWNDFQAACEEGLILKLVLRSLPSDPQDVNSEKGGKKWDGR